MHWSILTRAISPTWRNYWAKLKKHYKNGLAEKLDVDRLVRTAHQSAAQNKQSSRNVTEVGIAALKYQMGMPILQAITLTDTLTTAEIKTAVSVEHFDYSQRIEYQLLQAQRRRLMNMI